MAASVGASREEKKKNEGRSAGSDSRGADRSGQRHHPADASQHAFASGGLASRLAGRARADSPGSVGTLVPFPANAGNEPLSAAAE